MQHFISFSNSARKSFTRQKQATLLGQGAPSTSYVDQIQTARRGQTSGINSPYYISRNEAMTHPQDNRMIVAAQKKFQTLAGSDTNEFGIMGFRPTKLGLNKKNNQRPTTLEGIAASKYKRAKSDKLVLGNIVEGDADSVRVENSVPQPKVQEYLRNRFKVDGNVPDRVQGQYYKPVFDMHSHPDNTPQPSQTDMATNYQNRLNNKGKYEALIYTGKNPQGSKNAPYSITSYQQDTPTHEGATHVSNSNAGAKWQIQPNLGGAYQPPVKYTPEPKLELKLPW
jgi:hypothetical protein